MSFELVPAITAGLNMMIVILVDLLILKILKIPRSVMWYILFLLIGFFIQYPADLYLKPLIHQQLAAHIAK